MSFQRNVWKVRTFAVSIGYREYTTIPNLPGNSPKPNESSPYAVSPGVTSMTPLLLRSLPLEIPVFDGPEDRNGRRNNDEIRFWADYVTPGRSGYIYDDQGVQGGLKPGELFVIAGDQNSDPLDGDSIPGSIQQLLDNPLVNTKVTPTSLGGPWASRVQGNLNVLHRSNPLFDTADFCDTPAFPPCSGPGNLRADYVLPRKNLQITGAGVVWPSLDPADADPLAPFAYLVDPNGFGFPAPTSDHRAVWVDVTVPAN